jgi:hypothetical protein
MARRFSELTQGVGGGAAMSMAGITTQLGIRHNRLHWLDAPYFLSEVEELDVAAAGLESEVEEVLELEEESLDLESDLESDFDSPSDFAREPPLPALA